MKTTKTNLLLIIGIFMFIIGCSDDDSVDVDSVPEFVSLVEEISSLPGQTLTFQGVFSDPAGIETINIKYEDWFLDKSIVKSDSLFTTYTLSYDFLVPVDAEPNSSHVIPVTIANRGGITNTRDVVVTLNQDITNPILTIASPADSSTVLIGDGNEITLSFTATDEELAEVIIESTLVNETITVTDETFSYTNEFDISIPDTYTFTITATDLSGNITTKTVSVNVFNELLFDVMYITDVTTNEELNSDIFGIPYAAAASEVVGEDGYVFTAKYYSPVTNTEVRFLPQKTSFSPYTFGANPDVSGELALGTDATVSPIILPEIGYYEITMDLNTQSYTVTPYNPSDDAYDQVYVIGRGVFTADSSTCTSNVDGSNQCWHFNSGQPFVQDANSSYLWTLDVTIDDQPDDEGENGFILNANPSGWAPFWRVDNAEDPEATVPGGGSNYVFPDSALGGEYTLIFDTHLNRISAILR
ncbi:hypothetical protein [Winogradskyella thalassocola]|uniref:Uncharacterized protein n=1 Tax=Winogradskyella thalassocola TaxID=262004 RepID=A0A1G7WGS8_9FLAO|nr:hypothetical protein [Winogradskyella thalassocola]SDG70939.1 hypothetical protein SAMN04489796_101353 [Winogradskyella thalassocola]